MEELDNRNWFQRNWKWVVPSGGCLIIIILFIAFAGSMIFGLTKMFKESTPFQEAIVAAQSNELVVEALGEPIENYGMMEGSFNFSGDSGNANMEIPIQGPNGKAVLKVIAEKKGEEWIYELLEVEIKQSGDVIPLKIEERVLN